VYASFRGGARSYCKEALFQVKLEENNANFKFKYRARQILCKDPFELDSNLLLSSGRHGEDRKRQHFCATMKHRYLTIWLTYCTWHCLYCRCFSWHSFYSQELEHLCCFFFFFFGKKRKSNWF